MKKCLNKILKDSRKMRQRGITLIALVVTIIVLLLLAGITITMVAGNNGILKRATEAQEKTLIEEKREEVQMAISEVLADNDRRQRKGNSK